jgi:hypothetical protein
MFTRRADTAGTWLHENQQALDNQIRRRELRRRQWRWPWLGFSLLHLPWLK